MQTKIVAITGAAGYIGYSVLPLIASGQIYGPKVYIHLKLLDIQSAENSLRGLLMELQDCAFPLLVKIEYGFDPYVIFKDADLIIFLGSFSRGAVQTRRELLQYNRKIFKDQGRAANKVCKETCKFLVVANPANTNCTILSLYASNIPKQNFSALTRLDQNRTINQLAAKTNQDSQSIKGVIIWGNHSTTQYPDTNYVTINNIPIKNFFKDDKWLQTDLIQTVQNRGNKIIEIRKKSSSLATAYAIVGHCRDWIQGTKQGE